MLDLEFGIQIVLSQDRCYLWWDIRNRIVKFFQLLLWGSNAICCRHLSITYSHIIIIIISCCCCCYCCNYCYFCCSSPLFLHLIRICSYYCLVNYVFKCNHVKAFRPLMSFFLSRVMLLSMLMQEYGIKIHVQAQ